MSKRALALIAATFVSIIYGLTFTIAKDVMPHYVQAFGFIILRVGGSTLLFWITWFLSRTSKEIRNEKIDPKDYPRIVISAFFGIALNMLSFFKGLSLTTPISAAVLMVSTPMIVLLLSAIILKERLAKSVFLGIVLGLLGTVFLILYGKSVAGVTNASLGNFLVFVNATSYGLYLVLVKKLMEKYNPFNFVKWIYTIGFVMVLPFGWQEFEAINWDLMPVDIYLKIGYVVFFATFLNYLLNLLSMKELKPTTIAVFVYLQPFFATVFAISLGKDELNWVKIVSAVLIFSGVYLVTQKKKVDS